MIFSFLVDAFNRLRVRGMTTEGIFRKEGNTNRLKNTWVPFSWFIWVRWPKLVVQRYLKPSFDLIRVWILTNDNQWLTCIVIFQPTYFGCVNIPDQCTTHDVCSLIKRFFREIKSPIFAQTQSQVIGVSAVHSGNLVHRLYFGLLFLEKFLRFLFRSIRRPLISVNSMFHWIVEIAARFFAWVTAYCCF